MKSCVQPFLAALPLAAVLAGCSATPPTGPDNAGFDMPPADSIYPAGADTSAGYVPAAPMPPGRDIALTAPAQRVETDAGMTASSFLTTGQLYGYALSSELPQSRFGSLGLLMASEGETAQADGRLMAGLGWRNRSERGDHIGVNLLHRQEGESSAGSQWLASVQGGAQADRLPGKAKLQGEVALLRPASQSPGDDTPMGARLHVSGAEQGPVGYRLSASRFDSGFELAGTDAGWQQLSADLHYRELGPLRLSGRTEYRESGFDAGQYRRNRSSSVVLSGPLLKPWLETLSAQLSVTHADHLAPGSNVDRAMNHLDLTLTQPFANGWRYQLDMSLAEGDDRAHSQDIGHRQLQLKGSHPMQVGNFSGSIGPLLSMDSQYNLVDRRTYEAGFGMHLGDAAQQFRFQLGYRLTDYAKTQDSNSTVSFGVEYRLDTDSFPL